MSAPSDLTASTAASPAATRALTPGRHEPLGATVRDGGVNFAVFSAHASRVEVCFYDEAGTTELARHALHA